MPTPHPHVHPGTATLRCFAATLGGLALLTGWRCGLPWWGGLPPAVCLGVVASVRPSWLRHVYTGWLWLTFPPRWLIAHATLALLYFGLVTPLGLVRRVCRPHRDGVSSASYWVTRSGATNDCGYFRQF